GSDFSAIIGRAHCRRVRPRPKVFGNDPIVIAIVVDDVHPVASIIWICREIPPLLDRRPVQEDFKRKFRIRILFAVIDLDGERLSFVLENEIVQKISAFAEIRQHSLVGSNFDQTVIAIPNDLISLIGNGRQFDVSTLPLVSFEIACVIGANLESRFAQIGIGVELGRKNLCLSAPTASVCGLESAHGRKPVWIPRIQSVGSLGFVPVCDANEKQPTSTVREVVVIQSGIWNKRIGNVAAHLFQEIAFRRTNDELPDRATFEDSSVTAPPERGRGDRFVALLFFDPNTRSTSRSKTAQCHLNHSSYGTWKFTMPSAKNLLVTGTGTAPGP